MTETSAQHPNDEILGGRYRIISLLGRGGMGVVYRVEQIYLGTELALKTIDQATQSEIAIRRFQAEARAVFAVNHPNIVAVHDFGVLDDQTPFLAMEFVQGRTVGELIQTCTLSVEDVLKIFIQVCHGLAHAHKNGVVHRDIKPNNIMVLDSVPLGTEGGVKILDFGIAKLTQHEGGEMQALTRTGEIFGSPIYMSPEQCSGGNIDHRSDIYSLGCVIFEALTGTPPFVAESALSTMMAHQTAQIPTLKEASLGTNFAPELEEVVQTMLAKDPDERYQDLATAARDLVAIKSGNTGNLSIEGRAADAAGKTAGANLKAGAIAGRITGVNPKAAITGKNKALRKADLKKGTESKIAMKRYQFALAICAAAAISTVSTFLAMKVWFINEPKPAVHSAMPGTEVSDSENVQQNSGAESQHKQAAKADDEHLAFTKDIRSNKNIFFVRAATDQDFKAFQNYKGAQSVEAQNLGPHDLTNKGLSYLTASKLLVLVIRRDLRDIDNYAQLKYLNRLVLSKSTLNDAALSNIAKLKMLSRLNLEDVKNVTEDQIRQLIRSNSITALVLTKDAFSPAFIKELHEKMPQCVIHNYDPQPKLPDIKLHPEQSYKEAASRLAKIRAVKPDSVFVASNLKQMAQARLVQHRNAEAKALLEQAIRLLEKNGNDNALTEYLSEAALAAYLCNDLQAAVKYSDRMVELAPATMLHNDRHLYDMIRVAALYPEKARLWQKAAHYADVAIELFEKTPGALNRVSQMQFYSSAGEKKMLLNKNAEALADFKKQEQLSNTGSAEDMFWHASALVRIGRCSPSIDDQMKYYAKGMQQIEQAGAPDIANLLEQYCEACLYTADNLMQQRKWEDALPYLQKGLAIVDTKMMKNPAHIFAKSNQRSFAIRIAAIQRNLGKTDEARSVEEKYNLKTLHKER